MKITTEIIITLNEAERDALKKLLGNLTGKQKSEAGLTPEEQELTFEFYQALPYFDEED